MLFKVMFAIVLAVVAGLMAGPTAEIAGVKCVQLFGLLGQLFLNALSLVVVPLVSSSIIIGTARMGSDHSFGKLGAKTLGYFVFTTLAAILIGLFLTMVIAPGSSQHATPALASSIDLSRLAEITKQSEGDTFQKIEQIFLK